MQHKIGVSATYTISFYKRFDLSKRTQVYTMSFPIEGCLNLYYKISVQDRHISRQYRIIWQNSIPKELLWQYFNILDFRFWRRSRWHCYFCLMFYNIEYRCIYPVRKFEASFVICHSSNIVSDTISRWPTFVK